MSSRESVRRPHRVRAHLRDTRLPVGGRSDMTSKREWPSEPVRYRKLSPVYPTEKSPRRAERAAPAARTDWLIAAASMALVIAANVLALEGWRVPVAGPAVGFWFILVYPVYLCYTSSFWRGASAGERAGYSVTVVLLLLLLAGLFVNTVLPWIGISRPLDTLPVVIIADLLDGAFFLLRMRFPRPVRWRFQIASLGQREGRLLVAAALCVPLVVLGATRLNNGAGDQLTLAGLACMLVTFALLLRWQRWVREAVISAVIYLISLSALLMTSLRGWSITGHDIQGEYLVFQLTAASSHWDISSLPNSTYNACLSITILPTEISRVVHVYDPDVFKLFFQILFALCPVLVYAISRRHWSKVISILAVIYFVGFPTFFTDMPYENRQEIGFLFVSAGILAITNYWWTTRQRRTGLIVAALGIELSHYSTMYIFLGILIVGWAATRLLERLPWYSRRYRRGTAPRGMVRHTVNIGSIVAAAAILIGWGGLATGTAGSALSAIESAFSSSGGRSADVLYGVLHGSAPPPQVLLKQYRQQTLKQNAKAGSFFVPASVAAQYPTPYVTLPSLPLTKVGRLLNDHGIPVSTVNEDVRGGAAKDEQLFIGVGLIAIIGAAGFRRKVGPEFVALSIGSIVTLGLITVLPQLSVEYGVLRAFQEALIMIAPLLVIGSLTLFSPLGEVWRVRAATVVCLGFFFSTIGLMPQLLGGYPPQLNLNNSGQYYNDYYVHPQELAAVSWLADKPGVSPHGLQASVPPDRFNFFAPSDVTGKQFVIPVFPTLIERKTWLLLDYATVRTQVATADIDSDLINYHFPMALVENNKNLVYNNGGAEIFK
jgi:uncharacterized membrane protein